MKSKKKALAVAVISVLAVWLLAWAGLSYARNEKVTPEKIRVYMEEVDLSQLSGSQRREALEKLADMVNRLEDREERREAKGDISAQKEEDSGRRMSKAGQERRNLMRDRWWGVMTEEEQVQFVERTFPTSVTRMVQAFQRLDTEKRQRAIDDAIKRLRRARAENFPKKDGEEERPVLRETVRVRNKLIEEGLETYWRESSAELKAQMAPLMEELQRAMQNPRFFRDRR